MAVDTREKRQSAQALLLPFFAPGVDPSTLDQEERQAAAWGYASTLTVVGAGPRVGSLLLMGAGR